MRALLGVRDGAWRRRLPLAIAAVSCILISVALPAHGGVHYVRIVMGSIGMFLAPGWLLSETLVGSRSLLERAVAAVALSAAYLAVLGTMSGWADVRSTPTLFASVSVGLVLVLALFTPPPGGTEPVRLVPILVTLLAIGVTIGSTIVTHEALPRVPVESTFAIQTSRVSLSGLTAHVNLKITRIRYAAPLTLTVSVNYVAEKTFHIGDVTGPIEISFPFAHPGHCYTSTVQIETQNGQFLTPPLNCPSK
jgi:hypothetical protein